MSDQAMFSQLYNALVDNLGTPNFQLLGTPKDFSWGTAPTGQWDPAAYQIVSGMPQWSAIGQYGSLDATLFDAVRQIFGHVTFKVSPEQQANQAELANLCVQKSNAMAKANSDMDQFYLSSKQNGGLIFAARYPDINTWLNNAPEAAAYVAAIQAATNAYNQAVKMKMELERASMPSDLQRAIDMMQIPSGDPASNNAPAGWTKVPDGSGILRWQPDFHIDTTGADWRAALSNGSAGAFSIAMKSSQSSSDFKSSFAKGSTSVGNFFWSVNASGGWSKSDLFNQGVRPAINVGISVSRVGGDAQVKAMKTVSGSLRLDLSQYRELEAFAAFGSDLDAASAASLGRGERLVELLKQAQYSPLSTALMASSLFAVNKGFMDDIEVKQVLPFESGLHQFLKTSHGALLDRLNEKRAFDKEGKDEAELTAAITAFKKSFA